MTTSQKNEIERATGALHRRDGVIVIPTDTTYGVICRLDYPDAIERIYELKGRDRSKPLIILGSDPASLLRWATGDLRLAVELAERFWPGPLTLVVRATELVPGAILAGGKTVGLRMPRHEAALALLARTKNGSVASTSANLSGAGAPRTKSEVESCLGDKVDYILPDSGQAPAGNESTIIDVSATEPKLLRVGALSEETLMSAVNEIVRR
jgi:L-threonylcarbamoyladenylate synthase